MQVQKSKQGYKLVKSLFGKDENIPEEWSYSKMKNVCDKISVGIATSTTKHFVDKGIPLLRNQNIKRGYIETDNLLYISKEFAKINESKKLHEGDVVCMRTGYPGQSAVVTSEMNGWQTFTTLIIRPNHKILDSHYLSLFLNSHGRKQITSVQAGAAQQNLNAGWLSNMLIPIPDLNEQQKITSIISNVGSLILQIEKKIGQSQRLKKGLMQKLLTKGIGHVKFKQEKWFHGNKIDLPEDWQIVQVGKVVSSHKQGLYTTQSYANSGIKLVRVNDLQNPILTYDKMVHLELDEKTINSFKIQQNDFLIARTGNIGSFGVVTQDIQCVFVSDIIRFTFDPNLLSNQFFGILFQSELIKNQLSIIQQASSHIHINAETIKSLKIPLPKLSEQKRINEIISEITLLTRTYLNYKSKLENLKKGLTQKLLTGQIRVKV